MQTNTKLIFVIVLALFTIITVHSAAQHTPFNGGWSQSTTVDVNPLLSTKKTIVKYLFDPSSVARDMKIQVGVGDIVRVELDPHPTEAKKWISHKIYSTDIGEVTSVKTGSEGVVKTILSQDAASLRPPIQTVFEYEVLRNGNAIIHFESKDLESEETPAISQNLPLIATLIVACPNHPANEL